ncbi:TetR/AcrR family transcriptional regulator [Alloalcanivorax mobilis]|uniref:TetR/AcrR family transcriptional regulator n=1 Tax=Alloalcanivorax mobilis TaxID=2019569 RepID=UPI000C76F9CC|nr:TetR/AcrR family transcriptional regulator [Alloalcanivorax mobilis]
MPKPNVRHKLLAAGLRTLHDRGFNATSIQDITDSAAVPKGSFYNHFKSKEALGAEIVQVYSRQNRERLIALRDPGEAPLRRLRAYFESLLALTREDDFQCGCLLGNFGNELSVQSDLIRQRVAGALNSWTGALAKTIAEAQEDGTIGDDQPPEQLAAFLINAWQGALMRAKVERSDKPLTAFLRIMETRILV